MRLIHKSNYKIFNVPNEWFFFNPSIASNHKHFYKISRKTGVIFFNNNLDKFDDFFLIIKPFVIWCQKRRIKFFLPHSFFWANKYKAFGVLIDSKNPQKKSLLSINIFKKKFVLATKVHNYIEAKKASEVFRMIFISPVFKTESHPEQKPLKICIFISICFLLKEKITFALGGVKKSNYSRLKNKNLYGFAGIGNFVK